MVNRPPDPQTLRRKLSDIKLRYDSHSRDVLAKLNSRSRDRAAIRLAELTRWMEDVHGKGVELDMSEASYATVRIFAHHLGALKDAPRRIDKWVSIYAPWISPRDLERLINEVSACPLKWTADKLGWKIKLTDEQRTRLRITTIGGYDFCKQQREERRRQKRAARDKARYASKRANRSPSI